MAIYDARDKIYIIEIDWFPFSFRKDEYKGLSQNQYHLKHETVTHKNYHSIQAYVSYHVLKSTPNDVTCLQSVEKHGYM